MTPRARRRAADVGEDRAAYREMKDLSDQTYVPTLVAGDEVLANFDTDQLEKFLPEALARLGEKGSLWIAYLKQTASKATDINRDSINAYAGENGVTGVAMISMDSDWSALRLKRI